METLPVQNPEFLLFYAKVWIVLSDKTGNPSLDFTCLSPKPLPFGQKGEKFENWK